MTIKATSRAMTILVTLALLFSLFSTTAGASSNAAPSTAVSFTILHTNDFHGQLEEVLASPGTSSNPGMARVATIVNNVRATVGADKVLLVDGGDEMQGSLLSNLQQGVPTIDVFKKMGYNVATFGNHEFDWGQTVLANRTAQAATVAPDTSAFPYVTANIVKKDGVDCASSGWTPPDFATGGPYEIFTIGTTPNVVKVAFIGVTSAETPTITLASATTGLCFKDATDSIIHYYDEMKAAGADVIVVLSHLGYTDGGYGYGIPVYGDQTLAAKLNTAGKPVNLIIGGHSHANLSSAQTVGNTKVVQAHYNGRKVGRADLTVNPDGSVTVNWQRLWVCAANNSGTTDCPTVTPEDVTIKSLITTYANVSAYQELINTEIGWTNVPIMRDYNGDSVMGYFINDAIYGDLNNDATPVNDVDMVFNNPGGLRADITCAAYPCVINYGMMFNILPFGNQTIVGDMKGTHILELLHQSATLFKGALQTSGVRYSFFRYSDSLPGPQPYAWGAFDIQVFDKATQAWGPLDLNKTYRVATNEFLAPAGQEGFTPFKYMTNISYWGDMLDGANRWVGDTYYDAEHAYKSALDGRITRDGNKDDTYDTGEIVPLTVLHHNDSHGRLVKTTSLSGTVYQGYSQLVTLIKQERLHNPDRTLLLSSGDNIQGDSMMYYFKSAGLGYAADGTPLPPELSINPLIKAFNSMGYDAWTLGNHEFNFGKDVFGTLAQANFPTLQANILDDGQYGSAGVPVEPYVTKSIGPEGIKVAILGIGNHRVPSYELPSNIPGLTFTDPIQAGKDYAPTLQANNDVVIALTHIGFTTDPKSVEVDNNVDTYFATQVPGVDAIIGGHSHTNPVSGFGAYKWLPTFVQGPNNFPVLITQAYRYNTNLGQVVLGLLADGQGGYKVASSTGRYIPVVATTTSTATATPDDPDILALVQPYQDLITAYNNTVIGVTTSPIDALDAFTKETNGANLQADAAVWKLENEGIEVDFHLSGAMTNSKIAATATPSAPYSLKVSDMFTAMPYENSLVVMKMNGPQLKAVLERAYRNYFYYKYFANADPKYGGYSYYTTCMLDTNAGNQIVYNDLNPALPNGNNVVELVIGGVPVDFTDASKYYHVSSVNYLAAGACNFSDAGKTLWPLDQITDDTQYYVRDAVIEYVQSQTAPISPAVEGRLNFMTDTAGPVIMVNAPHVKTYLNSDPLTLDFSVTDTPAGVRSVNAQLDGAQVTSGQAVKLYLLPAGTTHTLAITAIDKAYNTNNAYVTFYVETSIQSMQTVVTNLYNDKKITSADVYKGLMDKLKAAAKEKSRSGKINQLKAFINLVKAQSGKKITKDTANLLITDVEWLIQHLP